LENNYWNIRIIKFGIGKLMGFRDYFEKLSDRGKLIKVEKEVSKKFEISGILKSMEPTPVLFEKIKESEFRVIGNLFCSKNSIGSYFGIKSNELILPEITKNPSCQEVESDVNLDLLPILYHCDRDGGNYISSAVVITRDQEYGQNMDFHRAMQFEYSKMSARVVKGRHFHKFLEKNNELEVAFCIGNAPNILLAAATSVDIGIDELWIANALEEFKVAKAKSVDLYIPADCEFVLEGKVYLNKRHEEGPFVDLTETYDIVRDEPIFEVKRITHRKNAIWQALLPGGLEHKVLMGMPREPTIYQSINKAGVKCLDVNVNPGGCSWLHAIVKIEKHSEYDGKKSIEAALTGHKSCKHVFIVDKDIDIYDPVNVEWAMATRFQGDADLLIKDKEPGSSLDPSAEPGSKMTTKMGFDMTKPLKKLEGKNFEKIDFPKIDVSKYVSR
jgi:2,5-furandicarboxylate decarboxylase 1